MPEFMDRILADKPNAGGDRKAAATPQVIAGDPFGIKPVYSLLRLLLLHRQFARWFEVLHPLHPLRYK
uniref:Uncharacterized protein n=1 Tax=Oryza glumipatula TaxID=40148 RepID=A0A0E0B8G5_9ORYZ